MERLAARRRDGSLRDALPSRNGTHCACDPSACRFGGRHVDPARHATEPDGIEVLPAQRSDGPVAVLPELALADGTAVSAARISIRRWCRASPIRTGGAPRGLRSAISGRRATRERRPSVNMAISAPVPIVNSAGFLAENRRPRSSCPPMSAAWAARIRPTS